MKITIATKYTPHGIYELENAGSYQDGAPALRIKRLDGERMLTATVCLDTAPRAGHVMIKDWSENEGVLDALVGAGVIEKPIRTIPAGFAKAYECKLTDAARAALEI